MRPSKKWSDTASFHGDPDLIDVVPDGQIVSLVCRKDGRIIDRASEVRDHGSGLATA